MMNEIALQEVESKLENDGLSVGIAFDANVFIAPGVSVKRYVENLLSLELVEIVNNYVRYKESINTALFRTVEGL